jgi:hypothetical protein
MVHCIEKMVPGWSVVDAVRGRRRQTSASTITRYHAGLQSNKGQKAASMKAYMANYECPADATTDNKRK